MFKHHKLLYISALLVVVSVTGCARAARDTTGFSLTDTVVVDAPFEEAWQTTKAVLRGMDLDIYTRDKRGTFVAFSRMKRTHKLFTPNRMRYSIVLESESENATRLTIESTKQVYGVTLLTYPDWHDRKTKDNSVAIQIIEEVKTRSAS